MATHFINRDRCPACLSSDSTILVEVPFNGCILKPLIARYYPAAPTDIEGKYRVASCHDCGTIYHTEVADGVLLREVYETWVDAVVDQGWIAQAEWLASNPEQSRDGHEIMTAAAILETRPSAMTTLDFGMGQGLWARVAKGLGCRSYGFDLSERCTRIARSHGVITIPLGDISDGEFHFINAEQVMEHVTDVDDVMKRLAAGLRPGALFKVSVPAQNHVREALSQLKAGETPDVVALDPAFPFEHVNAFTARGLEILGERFGLQRHWPTLGQRLTFLRYPGSVSARHVKNTLKELGRPFTSYEGTKNLTVWFKARR